MKTTLKCSILRVLQACDGLPMPETALVTAAKILCRPKAPTDGDVLDALHDLETGGYLSGFTYELTGERNWSLTVKGNLAARDV